MTLVASNEFARDWLEERYAKLIKSLLKGINGKDHSIRFIAK
ncbi:MULTISPECIES: DnaA N-terminal domain-containing protein [Peribacillus]